MTILSVNIDDQYLLDRIATADEHECARAKDANGNGIYLGGQKISSQPNGSRSWIYDFVYEIVHLNMS